MDYDRPALEDMRALMRHKLDKLRAEQPLTTAQQAWLVHTSLGLVDEVERLQIENKRLRQGRG